MTAAELDRHRIAETEKDVTELTAIVRSLERVVDRLGIEQAGVIGAVSKLEGKLEERDQNLQRSLARLHERLDERLEALQTRLSEAREAEIRAAGVRAERRRLWQQWRWITGAAISVGVLVVALLALILH